MVQRSHNSHQLYVRRLPFVARLKREEPFMPADAREWKDAADRIAGGAGWYSHAGFRGESGFKIIRFASPAEAEDMQRWIAESGIETRPVPPKYEGPQLSVADYNSK